MFQKYHIISKTFTRILNFFDKYFPPEPLNGEVQIKLRSFSISFLSYTQVVSVFRTFLFFVSSVDGWDGLGLPDCSSGLCVHECTSMMNVHTCDVCSDAKGN